MRKSKAFNYPAGTYFAFDSSTELVDCDPVSTRPACSPQQARDWLNAAGHSFAYVFELDLIKGIPELGKLVRQRWEDDEANGVVWQEFRGLLSRRWIPDEPDRWWTWIVDANRPATHFVSAFSFPNIAQAGHQDR